MKKRNNKKILLILLLLIIGISIGYAALATTLNINGNTTIEKASWDIHFENLVKITGSETATTEAAIDGTKTLIEYTVTLNEPGDFYEFTVDIVNNGTIDAMISEVLKEGLTTEQEKYIEYTATYSDAVKLEEKDYLKSGEKQNIRVRVKYRDDITAEELPTEDETLNLKFQVTYIQADETAKEKKLIGIVSQEEEGKLLPGDELAISTEHFYVVSSDENETVVLAKYNLLVGGIYNNGTKIKDITEADEGYGLQNETAKAYDGSAIWTGGISFSSTNYWNEKVGEGLQYPGSCADIDSTPGVHTFPDAPYVYDSNSNLYSHVEAYKEKLTGIGVEVQKARLLSIQELFSLGCVYTVTKSGPGSYTHEGRCPENSFVTKTTFWLGTAKTMYSIWFVSLPNGGYFKDNYYSYENFPAIGVRPVIVVNTSDIL